MRVAIVGAGALGSVFGGLLHEAGIDVTLIERNQKTVEYVRSEGLKLEGVSGSRTIPVKIEGANSKVDSADLVIVMVKTYDTRSAIDTISKALGPEGIVLTLQNGVGAFDILEEAFPGRTLLGTTTVGAMALESESCAHTGFGDTVLGEPDSRLSQRAQTVADLIDKAELGSAKASDNAMGAVWSKLVINCSINAPGTLLRLKNGDIPSSDYGKRLIKEIVEECVEVMDKKGVSLTFDNPMERVLGICESTAGNINSMFQDIKAGRRTEMDFINGAVVREGEALGVNVKVNETLALMIKALESTMDIRVRD